MNTSHLRPCVCLDSLFSFPYPYPFSSLSSSLQFSLGSALAEHWLLASLSLLHLIFLILSFFFVHFNFLCGVPSLKTTCVLNFIRTPFSLSFSYFSYVLFLFLICVAFFLFIILLPTFFFHPVAFLHLPSFLSSSV